ncbi:MAG: hypothetical protein IV298_11475 [Cylindrospermopsis raciborskii KL1]|uniref:hypothetical protein n=1 Tax=Cylindrospermopsis raciborskii TaxID=77022 RepID=UPI001454BD57|nr:hypothetical protein [Cylindrospermopsis raciborskii]MBG0744087.1 hypothetical protein [Cylindrospermopsis raciborskii KL1]
MVIRNEVILLAALSGVDRGVGTNPQALIKKDGIRSKGLPVMGMNKLTDSR